MGALGRISQLHSFLQDLGRIAICGSMQEFSSSTWELVFYSPFPTPESSPPCIPPPSSTTEKPLASNSTKHSQELLSHLPPKLSPLFSRESFVMSAGKSSGSLVLSTTCAHCPCHTVSFGRSIALISALSPAQPSLAL